MTRVLVLAGLGLVLAALADPKARRSIKLAWWFVSGEPMDGNPRTDAGWGRPATKVLTKTGHAPRWYHLRREIRAAVRVGALLGGLGVVYGLIFAYAVTVRSLESAVAAAVAASSAHGARAALTVQSGRAWVRPVHLGLGVAGGVAYRAALEWNHTRRHTRPLHLALGDLLGVPRAVRPKSWIELPRDFATRTGAKITVRLPQGFRITDEVPRRAVADIVCAILSLEAVSHKWHLAGNHPRVVFTVQIPPPDSVRLADVRDMLRTIADTALLVGLGRGREPVCWELDADSPHCCLSMGSGGGKSATARALVAQHLARGGVALILDVKRLSHAWARGLPNVRICRDISEIHDALIWLQGELDRRNEAADEGADLDGNTDHVDIGPRLLLVAEELNATAVRLGKYWAKVKGKDDPKTSPAVEALGDALFMGRQVRVNVIAIAQMLTARTVGGGEARENLGCRILARFTLNNWRVLVPEVWPAPRSSRHRGRMQVCVSGDVRETQGIFLTPAEARELATSGKVAEFPAFTMPAGAAVHGSDGASVSPMRGTSRAPVGLREAVASGILPVPEGSTAARTLEAVRKARQYDPDFPPAADGGGPGREALYDPEALESWSRNRPRAGAVA
jgi:hypothetical protein